MPARQISPPRFTTIMNYHFGGVLFLLSLYVFLSISHLFFLLIFLTLTIAFHAQLLIRIFLLKYFIFHCPPQTIYLFTPYIHICILYTLNNDPVVHCALESVLRGLLVGWAVVPCFCILDGGEFCNNHAYRGGG
jgi:hypothetical protein